MFDVVTENAFPLDMNSPEFKGNLKYFHDSHTILHFNEIKSLKDLIILSPNGITKLFSYVIAAHAILQNWKWIWLGLETAYQIAFFMSPFFNTCWIKFHSNYPVAGSIQVTQQQTLDNVLCFHLLACIIYEGSMVCWRRSSFAPIRVLTHLLFLRSFVQMIKILLKLSRRDYMFNIGFIPTSLLSQLITPCICGSVKRNDQPL